MYALRLLFHIEPLLEAINASASVNQLLFTGVERMALGADINLHLFLGGAGLKCFTAYAANDAFAVLGMDVFLHCCFTSFAYAMAIERKMYNTISVSLLQPFFLCLETSFDTLLMFVVELHEINVFQGRNLEDFMQKNTASSPKKFDVGGQAVMEGVMMRSPNATAVTVRRPDGSMVTKLTPFTPLKEKHPWMGIPFIRGVVNMCTMMYYGMNTLSDSTKNARYPG